MIGENFPYTNFHDMNLDWMIKIAKDFLDQYSTIQQLIEDGETSLTNLTTEGLQQLQDKADALEALLQAWYNEHSEDIANQLSDALADLNTWYTQHEGYLDQYVLDSIHDFNVSAEEKAEQTIASIPDDYSTLAEKVHRMEVASVNGELIAPVSIGVSGSFITENKIWYTYNQVSQLTPIKVNAGDVVTVRNAVTDDGRNANYAFLLNSSLDTSDTSNIIAAYLVKNGADYSVAIPEGVKYFSATIENAKADVVSISIDISYKTQKNFCGIYGYSYGDDIVRPGIIGKFITENSTWASYAPVTQSNPIPVLTGDLVTIKHTVTSGLPANMAFLTNNELDDTSTDNILKALKITDGYEYTVIVPKGATHLTFTFQNNLIRNVEIIIESPGVAKVFSVNPPINVQYRGLMASFNTNESKLRIFGTKNFHHFTEIGKTFYPTKGSTYCRDPFIMVYEDYFYIFYTDAHTASDECNTVGICRTRDFITYEEFEPVVCNSNFRWCWAPSVFEDNGLYYLTVSGAMDDVQHFSTYLYNLNMETLTISNERVIHIGDSTTQIDIHFYKFNGMYYAVGKREARTYTLIARASTLAGEYTQIGYSSYTGTYEEGQFLLRLDNGKYRLYLNDYATNRVICYVDIPDIDNPTQNLGQLKTITDTQALDLYHPSLIDFNRAYSCEEN